jgi:argonaute-like protein implicated in RNA metabolism and viral defense
VQALSTETISLGDFEYACALANASLATYAKLGGTPWLLRARPSIDHELVFGLGSHTHKESRRGAGERVVGITTVFSSQGNYLLDAQTAAVPFDRYPLALRKTLLTAIERVRQEEAWRSGDAVRLVFHAFTQLRHETAEAVIAAVEELGLGGVSFAFLHVAEDHPYTLFDRSAAVGKGAFGPTRGQAIELSDNEWLLALTGRERVKASFQGIPDPVLLRLHDRSTFRDMRTLARQVSDFACHSWRTYDQARLPITLLYADEIAKQLAGLDRTPGWDPDIATVGRIMRRPWFL